MSGERSPFMDRLLSLGVVAWLACLGYMVMGTALSAVVQFTSWSEWLALVLIATTAYIHVRISIRILKSVNGGRR